MSFPGCRCEGRTLGGETRGVQQPCPDRVAAAIPSASRSACTGSSWSMRVHGALRGPGGDTAAVRVRRGLSQRQRSRRACPTLRRATCGRWSSGKGAPIESRQHDVHVERPGRARLCSSGGVQSRGRLTNSAGTLPGGRAAGHRGQDPGLWRKPGPGGSCSRTPGPVALSNALASLSLRSSPVNWSVTLRLSPRRARVAGTGTGTRRQQHPQGAC